MAVKERQLIIGREFYADLLEMIMGNKTEEAEKLLAKLDDRELHNLSIGCSNICQLIRTIWLAR